MPITSFSFTDQKENWHLEETTFLENLNLLVGISGVGKTKILKAIELVCQVATQSKCQFNGEQWKIGFKYAGQEYQWTFESSLVKPNLSQFAPSKPSSILYEEILKKEGDQTITLIKRDESAFLLNNEEIPALRKNESAINLLSQLEIIKPIHQALKKFIFSEIWQPKHVGSRMNPSINRVETPPVPLETFQEESIKQPTVAKAYQLQQQYHDEFEQIKQKLIAIFSSVEDMKVELTKKAGVYEFSFCIKEKTSEKWISQWQMSAGMFRTIVHLVEMTLAPEGSVMVIDELENCLGTNCMPGLIEFILNQTSRLQVIMTSHHPYIIRNISPKTWKLVKRKGGQVTVLNAADIEQLTDSNPDQFIRLTSLPEYEGGIS